MAKEETKSIGITAKKLEDMPEWYSQVCIKAELADYSQIKGCMVIRPYGYAIWQKIQDYFNIRLKNLEVQNAYFPLFIPESFFTREAEHAEGFAPEVAWIERKSDTEDRFAVRPTSETIMYDAYSRWIRSWRDLPLRINQWCNIVRWEVKDVKLFLRTREFLWQEGHCVYETAEERDKEVFMILDEYKKLAEDILAVPVIKGKKSPNETFPGADFSTTIESLMPDGKALQMGTSHALNQGFAKAFNISFLGRDEKTIYPFQNSWGVSTRLIGAIVMMHGDDKGLVLPPMIAPIHIAIVPIYFDKNKEKVLEEAEKIYSKLSKNFSVKLDDRSEYSPGYKFNHWEMRGVPLRLELGPKDIDAKQIVLVRRDTGAKEAVPMAEMESKINTLLSEIQKDLLAKGKKFIETHTINVKTTEELKDAVSKGNWALADFCGIKECEAKLKEETGGITARAIPLDQKESKSSKCVHCGKEGKYKSYFARAY